MSVSTFLLARSEDCPDVMRVWLPHRPSPRGDCSGEGPGDQGRTGRLSWQLRSLCSLHTSKRSLWTGGWAGGEIPAPVSVSVPLVFSGELGDAQEGRPRLKTRGSQTPGTHQLPLHPPLQAAFSNHPTLPPSCGCPGVWTNHALNSHGRSLSLFASPGGGAGPPATR